MQPSPLDELETPFAVVDLTRVRRNVSRVADYARRHELSLRPHTKTHKDPGIAALQLENGAAGLTVATAREAEVMSRALVTGASAEASLLVAYPPVDPGRVRRLLGLPHRARGGALDVALDSEAALERLSAMNQDGPAVGVLIEVDLGGRRTGVADLGAILRLAERVLTLPGVDYRGILFHPGNLRHETLDPAERLVESGGAQTGNRAYEDALGELADGLRALVEGLGAAGFAPAVVSGGNTPTLFDTHRLGSHTEIRPGTYVYGDRDTTSQGIQSWHDCAYSIVATVVSTAVPGQAVVDAGSKALSKETLPGIEGLGALLERPDVRLKGLSEEHGVLDLSDTDFRPEVGDRLRIVPNHVCVSVNLQDRIAFIDGERFGVRDVAGRGRAPYGGTSDGRFRS